MAKRDIDKSLCDSFRSHAQRSTSTAKAVTTPIDVICQHSQDGTIVPLKIRVRDDDGEYQAYMIQGFREEERRGGITTFGHKRRIRLYYNEESGIWSMCG